MKKYFLILIGLLLILTLAIAEIMIAYLTDSQDSDNIITVGDIDVEIVVYFSRYENGEPKIYKDNLDYVAQVGSDSFTKFGVCRVSVTDPTDVQFIENFRVNVIIKSSVDTYFRVAPFEQLTITYEVKGKIREVAATEKGYMKFNYDPNNIFYDNRIADGFLYCRNKVKRNDEENPLVLNLVGEYFEGESFALFPEQYSLQIGFIIEAVQSKNGAQMCWGLEEPPWPGGGEW
ncbi:MAG: hypothetical protein PHN29_05515 [Endomicrobiaceae bacterium]|nr:hypothetical protein [Endomicrobiaceae bacterium]